MSARRRSSWLLAAAFLAGSPAGAKVVFTGYGDLRFSPAGQFDLSGPPGALAGLGLTGPQIKDSRGFSGNAVGLFTTAGIDEDLTFDLDLTFKNIGQDVQETKLQYAYLDYAPSPDFELRGGKITLPFGYYNENYFYPFQRDSITAPFFQTSILGLPIADWGATARKRWVLGPLGIQIDVYADNGYGSASSTTFRTAAIPSASNNLAGNLLPTNNNGTLAYGGRIAVSPASEPGNQAGVSFYHGDWDTGGNELFEMIDSHAHVVFMNFDLLAEVLHLTVHGDQGFAANVGNPDWETNGYFVRGSHPLFDVAEKPLVGWGRYEWYRTKGSGGGTGDEILESAAGGVSCHVRENLMLKAEYGWRNYSLPFSGVGSFNENGYYVTTAAVVTF